MHNYDVEMKPLKILVVAGHPADMFDHCGGTLLHHIQKGDSVTCVSLTQGLSVHDEVIFDIMRDGGAEKMSNEELEKIIDERQRVKYAETLEACKLFGLDDVRFLNYNEEVLLVTPELVSKLAQIMREVHPDLIITHWPYQGCMFSNHHAVTGQLTLAASTAAHRINFETKTAAIRSMQMAYMLCPLDTYPTSVNQFATAYANYYVEVDDVIDLKVKAIAMMKSQKYDTKGYAKKTTEQWNGNFGARIAGGYMEGFVLGSPEVGDTIPISPYKRWISQMDEHDILRRRGDLSAIDVEIEERD